MPNTPCPWLTPCHWQFETFPGMTTSWEVHHNLIMGKFSKYFRDIMSLHSINSFLHWKNREDGFPHRLRGFLIAYFEISSWCSRAVHQRTQTVCRRNWPGPKGSQPQGKPLMLLGAHSMLILKIFLSANYVGVPVLETKFQQWKRQSLPSRCFPFGNEGREMNKQLGSGG